MHLRLQDFRIVAEYNFASFKISSKLQLCGKKITESDMLEKTYSTFHASNVLLQQQYLEHMDLCVGSLGSKINGGEICLADSVITHIILQNQKYFPT